MCDLKRTREEKRKKRVCTHRSLFEAFLLRPHHAAETNCLRETRSEVMEKVCQLSSTPCFSDWQVEQSTATANSQHSTVQLFFTFSFFHSCSSTETTHSSQLQILIFESVTKKHSSASSILLPHGTCSRVNESPQSSPLFFLFFFFPI